MTNVAEINEEIDQVALIARLQQENRKLRDEGLTDDAAEAPLSPEELASLHAAVRRQSTVFGGPITRRLAYSTALCAWRALCASIYPAPPRTS